MLSMASVNRWIWRRATPVLIVCYLLFLVFDHVNFASNIDQRPGNLVPESDVDSLILGGSNAVFSLSAEILNQKTTGIWYNLGLFAEGSDDEDYAEFLENNIALNQRKQIINIVYSPLYQYRSGYINKRSMHPDIIEYRKDFSLLANVSPTDYIRHLISNGELVGNINTSLFIPKLSGDFDFKKYQCHIGQAMDSSYERERVDVAADWLAANIRRFNLLFPNAKITLLLPSEYYGNDDMERVSAKYSDRLFQKVQGNLKLRGFKGDIRFAAQPPYPDENYVCDRRHHGSEIGREWRTLEFVKQSVFHP